MMQYVLTMSFLNECREEIILGKHAGVEFRGTYFWVYDIVGGIFLWHLIQEAENFRIGKSVPWLENAIGGWRIAAVVTDQAQYTDDNWTEEQLNLVIKLGQLAIDKVKNRDEFNAKEIENWYICDDYKIFPRGYEKIPAKFIVSFAEAFIALLEGELPDAPQGSRWYYGIGSEYSPGTI